MIQFLIFITKLFGVHITDEIWSEWELWNFMGFTFYDHVTIGQALTFHGLNKVEFCLFDNI